MCIVTPVVLNQVGLGIGFLGSILLAFSAKVGVISKGGSVIFNGLDPMDPAEENLKRVHSSHWLNRYFTPVGWAMLAASFFLQFIALSA
jgi:hypothetical protein